MDYNELYDLIKSYRDKGKILPTFPFIIYDDVVYDYYYCDEFIYNSF